MGKPNYQPETPNQPENQPIPDDEITEPDPPVKKKDPVPQAPRYNSQYPETD